MDSRQLVYIVIGAAAIYGAYYYLYDSGAGNSNEKRKVVAQAHDMTQPYQAKKDAEKKISKYEIPSVVNPEQNLKMRSRLDSK